MWSNVTLELYPKDVNSLAWSTTSTNYNNLRDIQCSIGIGKKKDSFSFRSNNLNWNKYFNGTGSFKTEDQVKIYFYTGSSYTTSNLIFPGVIRDVSYDFNSKDIPIQGENFVESLFKIQCWFDNGGTSGAWDSPRIMREIVNRVNGMMEEASDPSKPRYIYGGTEAEWTGSCLNPTGQHDGTPFPSHSSIFEKYGAAYEYLEKYSGDEYTQDGLYMYYVDYDSANSRYLFKWRYRDNVPTSSISATDLRNVKFSTDPEEIINNLIVNCGVDLEGNGIEDLHENLSSARAYSPEIRYYSGAQNSFDEAWLKEFGLNPASFNKDEQGKPTSDKYPISYPYTFSFNTITESTWEEGASAWTVNSDGDFNDALRLRARLLGKRIAAQVLALYANPKKKINGECPITKDSNYVLGAVYTCNIPEINLSNEKLRLIQKDYSIEGITLIFEQDISLQT